MIGPKRIQLRRTKGWRLPASAISVARPGPWGNPFVIERRGPEDWLITAEQLWNSWRVLKETRQEAVAVAVQMHRIWIEGPTGTLLRHRAQDELRDHDLACWCAVDQPCHADVLLELANG